MIYISHKQTKLKTAKQNTPKSNKIGKKKLRMLTKVIYMLDNYYINSVHR